MSRDHCDGCKFAEWKRTAAGRLHPSGDGLCTYKVKIDPPELPGSMYWATFFLSPLGGYINRREKLPKRCRLFQKAEGV